MSKANFGVSLDEDLLQVLDERRGPIPRSRFIAGILAAYLEPLETRGGIEGTEAD